MSFFDVLPIGGALLGFGLARLPLRRLARALAAVAAAMMLDGLSRLALRQAQSIARRNPVRDPDKFR